MLRIRPYKSCDEKYIVKITIVILSIFLLSLSAFFIIEQYNNRIRIVIDSSNDTIQVPRNFRMCKRIVQASDKETPNLDGFEDLNISGSSQFSEEELAAIKQEISDKVHITIIDLKQESHGFINGSAVSWINGKNNLNKNFDKEEILNDENNKLTDIKINQKMTIEKENLVPTRVQNEKDLVEGLGMSYIRMPICDKEKPTDETVDQFIQIVKTMNADDWLHFHCEEGLGRTTTFMVMYDIMKNANKVTLEDIMSRQILFGGANLLENNRSNQTKQRAEFITEFYKYARYNDNNFITTWSQWLDD